jgi:predicted ATP-grasp superfamily ATP-dependent carboligase
VARGLLDQLDDALLIPVTEIACGAAFAHGLHQREDVAMPSVEAYRAAIDKHELLAAAARIGIRVPHSTLVEQPAELAELPADHAYPVVLKARRSRWLEGGHWRLGSVAVIRDREQLLRRSREPGFSAGALLQEFVPGHGEGLFLLVERGQTRVRFAHRRLREKPPSGGVSVLCESIAPDPELLAASERLLRELEWNGVAMVEFRRAPDGRAHLMEVNPRFWGSLQLAVDAGVDFPSLLVALHSGEPIPAVEPRLGVRLRWLLGDFDHLLIALRRPEMRRALDRSIPGVLGRFLASFADGSRLEVLRRGDLRPFLHELRQWLA